MNQFLRLYGYCSSTKGKLPTWVKTRKENGKNIPNQHKTIKHPKNKSFFHTENRKRNKSLSSEHNGLLNCALVEFREQCAAPWKFKTKTTTRSKAGSSACVCVCACSWTCTRTCVEDKTTAKRLNSRRVDLLDLIGTPGPVVIRTAVWALRLGLRRFVSVWPARPASIASFSPLITNADPREIAAYRPVKATPNKPLSKRPKPDVTPPKPRLVLFPG